MKTVILRTARHAKPLRIKDASFKIDNGILLIDIGGELVAAFTDWFACGYADIPYEAPAPAPATAPAPPPTRIVDAIKFWSLP